MYSKYMLVTVSGGRSSGASARIIQTIKKYKDYKKLYVFCNTGQEKPETIEFLKNMVKHWSLPLVLIEGVYSKKMGLGVRHKIVDFNNLSMNSEPFEGAIMQLNKNKWTGVPNIATPYCSDYLKTRVAHSLAKEIFKTTKYVKVLGFRKEDIPKRITLQEIDAYKGKLICPLITDFYNAVGNLWLNKWYQKQPFKLMLHNKFGNCELCWKKSESNLIQAIQNGVSCIDWYQKMETEYGNMFFRNNLSINDLVKMANQGIQQDAFKVENQDDGCVCNFM